MRYLILNMLVQPSTCTSVQAIPSNNRGSIQTSTLEHQKVKRLKKKNAFLLFPYFDCTGCTSSQTFANNRWNHGGTNE